MKSGKMADDLFDPQVEGKSPFMQVVSALHVCTVYTHTHVHAHAHAHTHAHTQRHRKNKNIVKFLKKCILLQILK